jgi:hypothetical protein
MPALHNQGRGDRKAWHGQQDQRDGGSLALQCYVEASSIAENSVSTCSHLQRRGRADGGVSTAEWGERR